VDKRTSFQKILHILKEFEEEIACLHFSAVAHKALEFIQTRLGITRVSIALLQQEKGGFMIYDAVTEIRGLESGDFLSFEKSALSEAVRRVEPLYQPNIKKQKPEYEVDKILLEAGFKSYLLIPLIVNNQCIGTLNVAAAKVNGIGESNRLVLQIIAPRLAQAIRNSLQIDELKKKEEIMRSDITERKRSEKALRESEARYKKLIDSVTDYIFTVDIKDGRPLSTKHGPGCIAVTGYATEEYDADPFLWLNMVHEEDREQVIKHSERLLSGETREPIEHRIIHKRGDVRWVRNTPVPRYDREGRLIAYDGLIVDITERKLAAEERQRLHDQLLHAQKMEAVGILAGGVAHDFNNILTAIIGYANIIKMKMRKDDPLKIHLEQIIASSERGANLTQSLLAFSRKQLISPRPVDLNMVIRNVQKLLSRVISEDIETQLVLDERPLTILADSGQIEQILLNLATNARDAMPRGGTLTLRTEMTTMDEQFIKKHGFGGPGIYALLSITDTGAGMDDKTRARIFEPFFTTKEVGRGTGLGLAMVYGAIKQNNGYIMVSSGLGTGTTFDIYLPLLRVEEREVKESRPVTLIKGGAETILIAEDDESLRKLAGSILGEFGYTVIEARDGHEAVEKFSARKEAVNLVILDVIMPKKNGREAYEEIKKINPQVKALFISGYTAEIVHTRGILDSGLNFLSKPIMPDQLLKKVREILDEPAI